MYKTYTFQKATVDINTLLCEDGDVILEIGNFPARFTVYLDRDGVQDLIRQLQETVKGEAFA